MSSDKPLTPLMREGARLDAQGKSIAQIAEITGRSVRQVSNWRGMPAYRAHVQELIDDIDRDLIGLMRTIRGEALLVARAAIAQSGRLLSRKGLTMGDAGTAAGTAHAWFKTAAAHTGFNEVQHAKVEVSNPEKALEELHARLAKLSPEQLRAIADDDGET